MESDNSEKLVTITGQLDVSDELCSDGTAALSIILDNGDEYVINNRRVVKRLQRFAYNQETLVFTGTVRQDSTGLKILSVQSCAKPVEKPKPAPRKTGRAASSAKKAAKSCRQQIRISPFLKCKGFVWNSARKMAFFMRRTM